MRLRDIIGLIIALLLAIGVAFLTRIFLAKEEKPAHEEVTQQQVGLTKILVAAQTLREGTKIKAGDLIWQEWPQKALNSSYIKEGTAKVENFTGAVVRFHLDKGEPLIITALVQPGEKGILAAMVSPGKRAVSIDVTPQSASSGLISPGDYVDVILSKSFTPAAGAQVGQSKTVLKNVKVLAIDVDTSSAQEKPKNAPHVATIEVTPAEAETVTAATKEGTLSLSLHSLQTDTSAGMPADASCQGDTCNGAVKQKTVILMRGKDKTEIQVQEQ